MKRLENIENDIGLLFDTISELSEILLEQKKRIDKCYENNRKNNINTFKLTESILTDFNNLEDRIRKLETDNGILREMNISLVKENNSLKREIKILREGGW